MKSRMSRWVRRRCSSRCQGVYAPFGKTVLMAEGGYSATACSKVMCAWLSVSRCTSCRRIWVVDVMGYLLRVHDTRQARDATGVASATAARRSCIGSALPAALAVPRRPRLPGGWEKAYGGGTGQEDGGGGT